MNYIDKVINQEFKDSLLGKTYLVLTGSGVCDYCKKKIEDGTIVHFKLEGDFCEECFKKLQII